MLKGSVLLYLGCLLSLQPFCRPVQAETQPRKLVPKSILSPATKPNLARPKVLKNPKIILKKAPNSFESVSFSILLGTPLIHENFYDKRFAALGNFHLFSIPILHPSEPWFIHFEAGPGFTLSKLTFQNPPQTFTHLYLVAPLRFRVIYSITDKFHMEGFAGVMLRPIEYDSRKTTDGGTHSVKGSNLISADVGVGFDYTLSPPLKIRLLAGYLFLSGGLELTL